jgi:hypothetical protein
MAKRRLAPLHGRRGFLIRAEPSVTDEVRRIARDRNLQHWVVVQAALELGLPRLAPLGDALPEYAYANRRRRGHEVAQMRVEINPAVADAVRTAASERNAHAGWVAQEALTLGLPLLPPPTQAAALGYDEELPRSA